MNFNDVHPSSGKDGPIESDEVRYGRNAETTSLRDSGYTMCRQCGFVCHLDRDTRGQRNSAQGDGNTLTTTYSSDAKTGGTIGITYDAVSTGSGDEVSSLTVSHTTTTESNRLLLVAVAAEDATAGTDQEVSGITYDGTAMTNVSAFPTDAYHRLELWYLLAPSTGANNIIVTFKGTVGDSGKGVSVAGVSYYGVRQVAPIISGAEVMVSTTSFSYPMVVSGRYILAVSTALINTATNTLTVGSNQTQRANITQAGSHVHSFSEQSVTDPSHIDLTWTVNNADSGGIIGAAFEPVVTRIEPVSDSGCPSCGSYLYVN